VRIVQVADYASPFAGSFVPMLRAALTEAAERGWEAQAVLPEGARERDWLPMLAEHEDRMVFAPPLHRRGRRRWVEELLEGHDEPVVLHSHFSLFDDAAAEAARRRPTVRTFWQVHTVLSGHPAVRAANRLKLSVRARPVERILCVAPHLVDAVVARGAPPEKVLYFPNAIETRAFAPAGPDERAAARELLGLPPDATVLLHFSRNWRAKGGDLFLAALALLRERGHDVIAACARGGEPALEQAKRLDIANAVFSLDHVPRSQDLYAASDLLMASSRGEGMPLTVLEAIASDLPVVASDIPGHQIPGADLPGLRHAALDPEGLAAAAEALLERDPDGASRDVLQGRRWIVENMDVLPWSRRLMDLYEHGP
jgi:glycosyltransferase involved in cell wall biosynthesis